MLDTIKTREANEFLMSNQQLKCIYEAAVKSQIYSPDSFSLPDGENKCLCYICWASMMSRYFASIILGSKLVLSEGTETPGII